MHSIAFILFNKLDVMLDIVNASGDFLWMQAELQQVMCHGMSASDHSRRNQVS
jgi:hypothetical protein